MKKLTDIEIKIIKYFNITPTKIQEAVAAEWMPSLAEVVEFCKRDCCTYPAVHNEIEAEYFLRDLAEKILEPEDCMSKVDLATWLLTNYFTRQELEDTPYEEILEFLKDWKYFFGFRKDDVHDVMTYVWDAQAVFDGAYILNPNGTDIEYIRKEE